YVFPVDQALREDPRLKIDIDEYALRVSDRVLAAQNGWSEEAFFEITPDFGEMLPEPPEPEPDPDDDGRLRNYVITVRALDKGRVITPSHYLELLRAIN